MRPQHRHMLSWAQNALEGHPQKTKLRRDLGHSRLAQLEAEETHCKSEQDVDRKFVESVWCAAGHSDEPGGRDSTRRWVRRTVRQEERMHAADVHGSTRLLVSVLSASKPGPTLRSPHRRMPTTTGQLAHPVC